MRQQVIPEGKPGRPFTDRQLDSILHFLGGQESFVLLESARISPENHRSLLFLRPRKLLTMTPQTRAADFFAALEAELGRGHYLAGWFAYELGYLLEPRLSPLLPQTKQPLALLGVFDRPIIYDHLQGTAVAGGETPGTDNAPLPEETTAKSATGRARPTPPRLSIAPAQYQEHIQRIRQYIAAGDTYQVNYTLKQCQTIAQSVNDLYRALRRNQRVCYAGLVKLGGQTTLSFSPELFFRKRGDACLVRPMKGTVRRGMTPEEDGALVDFLRQDSKNRSENVMIVDLLRNDLGRICRPGSVRTTALFEVESYETLHQMTSTIQGKLRNGVGLAEIFHALFPCGSVTGAPKIRTMEIIRELESEPRGVYTGALGFISPAGAEMVFNVPIRTVTMKRPEKACMGIGSGIVYDSDPEREWQECLLKGKFLSQPTPPFLLIETMLWRPQAGYLLLELHLERLFTSAAMLGFYVEEEKVRRGLRQLAQTFTAPQRVRLTLAKDGELELEHSPFTARGCFTWQDLPLGKTESLPRVSISSATTDPEYYLLYHKTSRRRLYDEERSRALAAGYCEVLFTNRRGELSEGAVSNLFVRRRGRLLTPPLTAGLLNGVLRRHLLRSDDPPLYEETLRPEDLTTAEAIYIGNSLRGLIQVRL
ncbi:MAG TPA: aminodeoxychorismate synthase component I [Desulfurivibrio alkaliphilus]|uniref:Aminodeoxychorismate synthase component I n=1 Tax=Desulfurivibrio alkaliphilus TaxID=427923 RepID=A0A7C2Y029_9BACT|nr:aminodeoxychorismate synthase component I [Desulfurivibrio alkaliphilus]